MEAIRAEKLTKRYKGVTALDGLDLTVEQGELFTLLGVNGAGKTTAIRLMCCLLKPDGGDAFLQGVSVRACPAQVKRLIGFSPQQTAAAPNLTVQENLELMAGLQGLSGPDRRRKTQELLEEFELAPLKKRRAGRLSGGWQRRLSLAMALAGEPQALFLDEPTLGLDVLARRQLWESIRRLKGKTAILMTTHYMEEAEALSDRVGVMRQGRLLAAGTAAQLKARTGAGTLEEAFVSLVSQRS